MNGALSLQTTGQFILVQQDCGLLNHGSPQGDIAELPGKEPVNATAQRGENPRISVHVFNTFDTWRRKNERSNRNSGCDEEVVKSEPGV